MDLRAAAPQAPIDRVSGTACQRARSEAVAGVGTGPLGGYFPACSNTNAAGTAPEPTVSNER